MKRPENSGRFFVVFLQAVKSTPPPAFVQCAKNQVGVGITVAAAIVTTKGVGDVVLLHIHVIAQYGTAHAQIGTGIEQVVIGASNLF